MKYFRKLQLWWWSVTHILELVDYQAERIDYLEDVLFVEPVIAKITRKAKPKKKAVKLEKS